VALVGNRTALARRCRWVDEDLNRIWSTERLLELREGALPKSVEEAELLELAGAIAEAATEARHGVWLLDLHTTSGEGPPFGVLDDTMPNREFARLFRLPYVVGLEEELDGTVLGYFVSRGARTFGLECGQHDDPASIDRAEAAIWIALAGLGLIEEDAVPNLEAAHKTLTAEARGLPSVVEIRYRHAIEESDRFRMEPGYVSFQRIQKGEVFSRDASGPVAAPEKGRLLMPLYQKQGNDGFFVVRRVGRAWMRLSAWLRHLRAERYLRWFPGVQAVPGDNDSFIVDRTVARWFAVELLHLLGFRRHGHSGRYLVVSRRPNNATEPVHPRHD
jgi:succinylglutamate desuccinylase